MDHKQKKDLQKKTERKRDNKDKKQSEKTRELEESKGTRVIHPFWFAVVGFILSMVALLSWFFSVSLRRFLKYAVNTLHISYDIQ
jgi:uncharacterized membrane protein